jgi:hypothetical protein
MVSWWIVVLLCVLCTCVGWCVALVQIQSIFKKQLKYPGSDIRRIIDQFYHKDSPKPER